MSIPLKDLRFGITELIDMALEADAVAFKKDRAEVAREVLHGWALRKAHAYSVWAKLAAANGLPPDIAREAPEDTGTSRQDRSR